MALALVLSVFVDIAVLVVPIYDMQLYDRVIQSRSMDTLASLSVACLVGLALYGMVDYLRSAVLVLIADRVARRLHGPVLCEAVRRGAAGHASAGVDAVRDLDELRLFLSSGAVAAPLDALCAPLLLAVLFMLHPAYGFLGVCGVAVLLLLGLVAEGLGRRGLVEATQRRAALANRLSSQLREPALTEGLGMLPAIARRWAGEQGQALGALRAASARSERLAGVSRLVRLVLQAGVMVMGALMILAHATTPGSLMGANLLLNKLLNPFDHLVESWRQWSLARAAWGRIDGLLRDAAGPAERAAAGRVASEAEGASAAAGVVATVAAGGTGDVAAAATAGGARGKARDEAAGGAAGGVGEAAGLRLRGVGVSRGGRRLLQDVGFMVPPGCALAVTGPNGGGKSTLLRLLAGVVEPDAGEVLLDGLPTAPGGRRIGYLPQSVSLLDGSIADNVMRFAARDDAATAEAILACRRAGVHEMIGRLRLGYDAPAGEAGVGLSGGQHQRIGLARALFGTPRLLLLDEPDASLDHEGDAALLRAVAAARDASAVVVVVTHRASLLAAMDLRLELREGRVAAFGPAALHEEALRAAARPEEAAGVAMAAAAGLGDAVPAGVADGAVAGAGPQGLHRVRASTATRSGHA